MNTKFTEINNAYVYNKFKSFNVLCTIHLIVAYTFDTH